jgi:hypothetical protein
VKKNTEQNKKERELRKKYKVQQKKTDKAKKDHNIRKVNTVIATNRRLPESCVFECQAALTQQEQFYIFGRL